MTDGMISRATVCYFRAEMGRGEGGGGVADTQVCITIQVETCRFW